MPQPWHIGDRADDIENSDSVPPLPAGGAPACTGAACTQKVFSSHSEGIQVAFRWYPAALQKARGIPSAGLQMSV